MAADLLTTVTDPTYFPDPTGGDISYPGDTPITLGDASPNLCTVGEIDPISGDTIAGCPSGGGVTVSDVTPSPVSPSLWSQIGGVLGGVLGGLQSSGVIGGVNAQTKVCSNGMRVPVTATCPTTLSSSTNSMMLLLLAVVLVIFVIAMRK